MYSPFAAALFAGGRSRRFGSDKAFHEIDGVPLWRSQIGKLEELMPSEIIISANDDQVFDTPYRVVRDELPDRGPLVALISCLKATRIGRLLVLAVDLPDMPVSFLGELAWAGNGCIGRHPGGMYEPLAAVYPSAALELAEDLLSEGRDSMQDLARAAVGDNLLQVREIRENEQPYFANLNRPDER